MIKIVRTHVILLGGVSMKIESKGQIEKEEVNQFLNDLTEKMNKESYQEAFNWVQDKIRACPDSEELIVQASAVLNACRIVKDIPDEEQYDASITGWLERGLLSGDEGLRTMAADALYNLCLTREEYEKAQEYLQYFSDQDPEKQYRQAMIYSRTGQFEDAYRTYEELLFSSQSRVMMILNGIYMLSLQERDFDRANHMADKIEQFAKIFEMGRYYEVSHRLDLVVQKQDKEACIELAKEMLACIQDIGSFTKSPLYSHMTFREMADEHGRTMREELLRCFRDEETFKFMDQDERWKQIIE